MTRFDEAVFLATHNSYEPGRGTIAEQLDSGVRFLEFDVHYEGFRERGYTIGHFRPGHSVEKGGGNPSGIDLASWLGVVADWSAANRSHAPITVTFDPKADLTEPESFDAGNFGALNALLADLFGERLLPAWELADRAWPELDELRGRVLFVLSGDRGGRLGYVRDGGREPAVAIDGSGTVVEAHGSGGGGLWYWTGRHEGGRVRWARHGRYANGHTPAVAIADGGAAVSIHDSLSFGAACCVGRIDRGSLEIEWAEPRGAVLPAAAASPRAHVRFDGEDRVRVTYESSHGRMAFGGRVGDGRIEWDDNDSAEPATAADARHHPDHAVRDGVEISVVAVHDGGDGTRLLYATGTVDAEPIRYEQAIFVEGKFEPEPLVHDLAPVVGPHEPRFYAVAAGSGDRLEWARALRERGKLVRFWGFDEAATARELAPSFPACDHPAAGWYTRWCGEQGALEPPARL